MNLLERTSYLYHEESAAMRMPQTEQTAANELGAQDATADRLTAMTDARALYFGAFAVEGYSKEEREAPTPRRNFRNDVNEAYNGNHSK